MSNSTASAGPPSSESSSAFLPTSNAPSSSAPSSSAAPPPSTAPSSSAPSAQPPPSSAQPPPSSAAPTTVVGPTSFTAVTSVVTLVSSDSFSAAPTTITFTSTSQSPDPTTFVSSTTPATTPASSSTEATPLPSSTASAGSGNSSNHTRNIAVGVAVPVVAVTLIVLALLFWWRKRKQKKDAEEMRRKEVEEYGYNPNRDATLAGAVGSSGSATDPYESPQDDPSGYRGWGTAPAASAPRKLSTTLSNANSNGPIGVALSDGPTPPSGPPGSSPTHPSMSEAPSGEPLLTGTHHRPTTADSETIGELGGAPVAGTTKREINRGPSNASSSYSAANRSDISGDGSVPGGAQSATSGNHSESAFGEDGPLRMHGPYEGPYSGAPPVIRDVQARRNTRIENPTVYPPPPGNAGIAQNF